MYGAAKTYVDSLSRSLDAEVASSGVRVQNLWPMFVCEWRDAIPPVVMLRCSRVASSNLEGRHGQFHS